MQTLDTQSDFLLLDRVESGKPFEMRYRAEEGEKEVVASWDGSTYVGCQPFNESFILVPINAGSIDEGRLVVRRHYSMPHEAFADDQQLNHRYTQRLDVRLREHASPSPSVVFSLETDERMAAELILKQFLPTSELATPEQIAAFEQLKARIEQMRELSTTSNNQP